MLVSGAILWFVWQKRQPAREKTDEKRGAFRWTYIISPLIIFIISIVLVAYFYPQLPASVAYNFKPGSSPDNWLSRDMLIVYLLLPQLVLILMAAAIAWGAARIGRSLNPAERTRIKPDKIILLMGNIVALPQIILCFALADIFSYNSYQAHIMPLWLFVAVVMVAGAIILSVFFFSAMRSTRRIN